MAYKKKVNPPAKRDPILRSSNFRKVRPRLKTYTGELLDSARYTRKIGTAKRNLRAKRLKAMRKEGMKSKARSHVLYNRPTHDDRGKRPA